MLLLKESYSITSVTPKMIDSGQTKSSSLFTTLKVCRHRNWTSAKLNAICNSKVPLARPAHTQRISCQRQIATAEPVGTKVSSPPNSKTALIIEPMQNARSATERCQSCLGKRRCRICFGKRWNLQSRQQHPAMETRLTATTIHRPTTSSITYACTGCGGTTSSI